MKDLYSPPRFAADGSLVSHGCLFIDKSLEQTRAGGLRVKAPKSRRGRRVVSVPMFLADILEERRRQVGALRACPSFVDRDLIVCTDDGGHYRPDTCSSNARAFMRNHGHPDKSLHSIRHAHASWLCQSHWLTTADGETTIQAPPLSAVAIADRLGHDPTLSVTVYQHLIAATTDPAVVKLDALFAANGR